MAQITILNETRSHFSGTPFGDKGEDVFPFNIPDHSSYASTNLNIIDNDDGRGGARLLEVPDHGQRGAARVVVHWWYDGHAKIRYNVNCLANPDPAEGPEAGLELAEITFDPAPARAGENLTVNARVVNTGRRRIEEVIVVLRGTVTHLDDVRDEFLNAFSEEQRTRETQAWSARLDLDPGAETTITRSGTVPARISNAISAAGLYTLRVTVRAPGGTLLGQRTFYDFRVVR